MDAKRCITCCEDTLSLFKCQDCSYEICISCAFELARSNVDNDKETTCPQCRRPFYVKDLDRQIYISHKKPKKIKMFKFTGLDQEINIYDQLPCTIGLSFKDFYATFKNVFSLTQGLEIMCTMSHNFKLTRQTFLYERIQVFEFSSQTCTDTIYGNGEELEECIVKRNLTLATRAVLFDLEETKMILSIINREPNHILHYCLVCNKGILPIDNNLSHLKSTIPKHLKSATHLKKLKAYTA